MMSGSRTSRNPSVSRRLKSSYIFSTILTFDIYRSILVGNSLRLRALGRHLGPEGASRSGRRASERAAARVYRKHDPRDEAAVVRYQKQNRIADVVGFDHIDVHEIRGH